MPAQLTGTKASFGAGAGGVDGPGDDFLADAAFARDQNLRVRPRDALELGLELGDHRAVADELHVSVLFHLVPLTAGWRFATDAPAPVAVTSAWQKFRRRGNCKDTSSGSPPSSSPISRL